MGGSPKNRSLATDKRSSWVGGVGQFPGFIGGDDGEPYRPEILIWMTEDGLVLGHHLDEPGKLEASVITSLEETIARPLIGAPGAPRRIRVSSRELAQAVRSARPDIEVVDAPTPEIDDVLTAMREDLSKDDLPATYLAGDVEPAQLAAFFRAVAALHRAAPWKTVPSDESLIAVTIADLQVHDVVISIIGQLEQSYGLLVFASEEDFEQYLDGADAMKHGEEPRLPRQLALNFERGADLAPALRQEISRFGWEVAGPSAYPCAVVVEPDLVARSPSSKEMAILEAISLALPLFLSEKERVLAAWSGDTPPIERTVRVQAHARELDVTLRLPTEPSMAATPFPLINELIALGGRGVDLDDDTRERLGDELLHSFAESPEAEGVEDQGACRFIMDFGASYFGATIVTLRPRELREILFEIIPRKVAISPSEAPALIAEARAFFRFLGRAYALPQARACLRVLDGDASQTLRAALADSSRYGMAKSIFSMGREAGFDIESKEGIEDFMRALERAPSTGFIGSQPGSSTAAKGVRKDKRKAARKSKRKNR